MSDPQSTPQPHDPERSAAVGDDVAGVDRVEGVGPVERVEPVEGDESARRVERIEIDEPVETDVSDDVVTVRRAPRYGRFITLGALLGAVVALIVTFAFSGQPAQPELELGFDRGQVFGFLLLLCATIGAALGAVVALLIDRGSAKRAKSVLVVHESTHRVDE
ncbi:hypothetical protein [Agromyces ramosus]|uniref:hypothetical protein n=1 Tax=Agromyces ramosus TaxID=33879 RepID=UPI001F5E92C4|nr:hypothetical protein [Agromyces ramosus]